MGLEKRTVGSMGILSRTVEVALASTREVGKESSPGCAAWSAEPEGFKRGIGGVTGQIGFLATGKLISHAARLPLESGRLVVSNYSTCLDGCSSLVPGSDLKCVRLSGRRRTSVSSWWGLMAQDSDTA